MRHVPRARWFSNLLTLTPSFVWLPFGVGYTGACAVFRLESLLIDRCAHGTDAGTTKMRSTHDLISPKAEHPTTPTHSLKTPRCIAQTGTHEPPKSDPVKGGAEPELVRLFAVDGLTLARLPPWNHLIKDPERIQ